MEWMIKTQMELSGARDGDGGPGSVGKCKGRVVE